MRRQAGFTMIELLVVVGIICLLMAMIMPAAALFKRQAQKTNTRALVRAVTLAATNYQLNALTIPDGSGGWRAYPAWDWNRDNVLDARPEVDDPAILANGHSDHQVYVTGYVGFVETVRPEIKPSFVNARGHLIDAWKQELHVAHGKKIYGSSGIGIWSIGPDGINASGSSESDDIVGWDSK